MFEQWIGDCPIPKPMLAIEYDRTYLEPNFIMQAKLRGVRGILHGERMYSRTGREFTSLRGLIQGPADTFLDGEIYTEGWSQQRIMSAVTCDSPTDDSYILNYYAFDLIVPDIVAFQRARDLKEMIANDWPELYTVPMCFNMDDSETMYHFWLKRFEGVVYRNSFNYYQHGKTSAVMKRKPWQDADGEIINVVEGRGKRKGMLGKFILKLANGDILHVGGGNMTEEDMRGFLANPPIGKFVKFRFQFTSDDGLPQQPQFESLREY